MPRYLSTATSLSLISAYGCATAAVSARRWTDIVTTRRKTQRDRFRYNLLLESDDAAATSSVSPPRRPTRPPSLRPTTRPTVPMTPAPVAPTASPTPASLCPTGYMPYEVHMYDRFGDGWDGTSLVITEAFGSEESFRGTLRRGHKAVQGACLSATKCHRVSV